MKKTKKVKTNAESTAIIGNLNIPDDQVWDYKIDGLAAPMIGKTYKNFTVKKILLVIAVLIVVSLSFLFSVIALMSDTFEYEELSDGKYMLSQFSNTGNIKELDIDYVSDVLEEKVLENKEIEVVFSKDETKPVTEIREYAFNCDEKVEVINIGPQVTKIDAKSFYSCWKLERIEVDEDNPVYCDVDGVLYTKDMKTLVCLPINHDLYLAKQDGIEVDLWPGDDGYEEYKKNYMTIVIPSTVETIGDLALNYNALSDIYLPEGLKTIGDLAFFESTLTENIYTYKGESEQIIGADKINFSAENVYLSLPEGLESIGTDAFNYNQALSYMYVPSSVKFIGHHAFWGTVYKEGKELKGVAYIDVAADEGAFDSVEKGNNWLPQFDNGLFPKEIEVKYGATRKAMS
ncbi:MAG: leucine-rich repeat protein [Clostridia bacterium]|nr:leucine-rich repeat protein [Clostridia bacterium]